MIGLNKLYNFFMATLVGIGIISRHGLRIEVHHSQANPRRLSYHCMYKPLLLFSEQLYIAK